MQKRRQFILTILLLIFLTTVNSSIVSAKPILHLTVTDLNLVVDGKHNINIKNKIKGSTYNWLSSDTDILTVNKNNGLVRAVNQGTATVRCEIKKPDGIKEVLTCNVTIHNKPRIKDNDLYLLAFTIDDSSTIQTFLDKGVDTICTNFIEFKDIK